MEPDGTTLDIKIQSQNSAAVFVYRNHELLTENNTGTLLAAAECRDYFLYVSLRREDFQVLTWF